ncbi:putative baseplate assembly protein [Pyxidicoccus xibeiensis]|uniref:putative baseplate assembly protein n=1 Tax=Pyxidicoccus xibeiensis TaxID=2906759 RepID=UPI0020A6F7AF|nr:putative baseplate assembly protein [Pyxidicoccus xibeiensis]MCP3141705.1 putative baseplate assembly protein [Pyxidicoccus xibeiensis]
MTSLPTPRLDDRGFAQLVEQARARILASCPDWTDLSPHDPGMVLVEVFSHLTETMLYRLNRLPEKAYVEFLRLLGVRLQPPAAASVRLRFTLARPAERPVEIPRSTPVTLARAGAGAEPVVFHTADSVALAPGSTEVEVLAYHCEQVDAELVGQGTGQPGLTVQAKRPPIVAPTGDSLDLVVGVEADPDELDARAPARRHGGRTYRVWREVDNFAALAPDEPAYLVDRMTGVITFAPSARLASEAGELGEPRALAAVPGAGREIRLWYRRGGGASGNVAAGTLELLKAPIAGVKVTNPRPATGGRPAETLENALLRGPQELHSLRRAVTAGDFELLALRSSGAVARAKAVTLAQLWAHAPAGTVEVLLVPHLPPDVQGAAGEGITDATLREHETEDARARIHAELDVRRPLGTACHVEWARYKTVRVQARVVAHREEDTAALRTRLVERLHRTLTPLPSALQPEGWRFGQALRASHVYDALLAEPGVSYLDRVRLMVDEVPQEVRTLAADNFQAGTFYAGGGETLFRTVNDADGWEKAGLFPGEDVDAVEAHPQRPGYVAVSARLASDAKRSRIHLSYDCGETWEPFTHTLDAVEDIAWAEREGVPVLLLATRVGLFELVARAGATPIQVLVDPANQDLGFFAVAATTDVRGAVNVAVAAMGTRGVFLSAGGGRSGTFRPIGPRGADVRVLEVQRDGPRSFLWAGLAAASGADPGKGCLCWELMGTADPPDGWRPFDKGWDGGSCLTLAFSGSTVYAGSHRVGVLWLDSSRPGVTWRKPDVGCGLPLREAERLFQPVAALATPPGGSPLLAGGPDGVFRKVVGGERYEPVSTREFTEKVTLPPTWLLCSGAHVLEVVTDHAEP